MARDHERNIDGTRRSLCDLGPAGGPCWLRLVKSGSTVTGSISPDGVSWSHIGETTLTGKVVRVGLTANSGLPNLTTTVRFDHVTVR